MRFFIALEIPEPSKTELTTVQSNLQKWVPGLKPTDPAKMHLTIAFIGEQEDKLKGSLIQMMTKAASGIRSFEVTPAYLDGFPKLHTAHTLWVGVKGDIDKLMIIRERIKDGLKEIGITVDERRYTPHITLGKVDGFSLSSDTEAKFQQLMQSGFQPIQILSIKLFESVPDNGFHSHNTLAEIKLD